MSEEDSDDDGMPDGWEVMNGLDALTSSADNDADSDGKTDLEEYIDGTDPNVKEKSGKDPQTWIIGLIILIIMIIIGVGIGLFIVNKRKKNADTLKSSQTNEMEQISVEVPQVLVDETPIREDP